MRSFGLALLLLVLAITASPASAAVIEIEDHFCGCDGSSGETDTRGIVVRANAGETNSVTVRRGPRASSSTTRARRSRVAAAPR